jgi:hypothetical protein
MSHIKKFFLSYLITFVHTYGYNAHGYLGGMSDKYLSLYEPVIYKNITNLISGNLHSISSWADKIKRNNRYSWTSTLHYIDILECNKDIYDKSIIDKYCNNNCIVSAIKDFTNSLKYNKGHDYKTGIDLLTRSDQLKFLIHFIQDFNQPMHLLGYDRGGNSLKVNIYIDGKNRTSNMHYIWDSMLPDYYIDNYAYTVPFEKVKSPANFNIDNLLESVLNENIKEVACKIYPDHKDNQVYYLIFNDYFKDNYFKLLFDNYHKMSILILKHIFE